MSQEDAARLLLQDAANGKFRRDHVETFLTLARVPVVSFR
jgi:hypothetical protein